MNENKDLKTGAALCGGVSFSELLGLAFIILKLCGVIKWSWWWVTAPLWMPFAIGLIIVLLTLMVMGIQLLSEK